MKKVLVVGAGRMGKAICYGLMKLGINVGVFDSDWNKAQNVANELSVLSSATIEVIDLSFMGDFDLVISAATYTVNYEIARKAIDRKIPYCDLGGHIETSQQIHTYAKEKNGLVFTDLGLAPGLVNILGEFALDDLERMGEKPVSIDLRVGGLPSPYAEMGLLKYNLTWSVEGLINEYLDNCKILENGEVVEVCGLTGIEEIDFGDSRKFEAFYTSGGLSHTLDSARARGLSGATYKTIRYKGHAQQVRFLLEACGDDREQLVKLIKNCSVSHNKDVVWIYLRVSSKNTDITRRYAINWGNNFTAMQKATAFSAASVVANLVGDYAGLNCEDQGNLGYLSDYVGDKNVLNYRQVHKQSFVNNMKTLGIHL